MKTAIRHIAEALAFAAMAVVFFFSEACSAHAPLILVSGAALVIGILIEAFIE